MKKLLPLLIVLLVSACQKQKFDVIIRGGTVYDGSGKPGVITDVGINADTVAVVGDLSKAEGKTEINAEGLVVAPGFINMLSWATESLIMDGNSQADIRQGVTLEVFGEGQSMGPLNETMKGDIQAEMQRNPDWRYDIDWTTLDEYLQSLQRRGIATNVASFIGATTVRIHELGYDNRLPDSEEMDRMKELVRQA